MRKPIKQVLENLINHRSLKNRLTIALIISSFIPLVLIGLVSFYTIMYEMRNRVEVAIQSNLKQVRVNLENALNNLDYVSRQLAFSGTIAEKFVAYMDSEVLFDKYLLNVDIKNSISIISNTNPNIGVILYYSEKNRDVLFSNNTFIGDFHLENLHLLSDGRGEKFYGPSPTVNNSMNNEVFSIVRSMDNYYLEDYYVYVETDVKLVNELLIPNQYSIKADHLLTDQQGIIVYNGGNPEFSVGEKLGVSSSNTSIQQLGENYLMNEVSHQGWKIYAVISKSGFNRALDQWLVRFLLISAGTLFLSLLFALLIWRTITIPMKAIKNEIILMTENNYSSEYKFTHILEFDELLDYFYNMKLKVHELLEEVENKERTKRHLEVEKLMHQINPHFLHNTLNTVQWLARENSQTEIARIIALLTKVLYYNMAKEGMMATIEMEINTLKAYVELQKIRYDHSIEVTFHVDEDILDGEIPRFTLQPLVENAIYHGLKCDKGMIRVEAVRLGEKLRIMIADNGIGMNEYEIKRNLEKELEEVNRKGLGIGISYVNKMIQASYGDAGSINIHSEPGKTEFIIEIPFKRTRLDDNPFKNIRGDFINDQGSCG